ncbi:protein FAM131C isoform X4 [Zalophus californianus]|uniref:Protein FAM131C isoform X4 n=1 Tax=Zalophus californianus TaxID=9704 RepID=A0A6P9F7J0_ZALCA|nr:protein FAM131C isoform X4 [Zalophus californianus]
MEPSAIARELTEERDLFTSAHKDCPMPQGTDPLNPDLTSSHPPTVAPDHVTGKDKQMDFCWDPWQRCFQTTNGYLSDSRSCSSNYNVAALATSSLVGVAEQFAITEATLSAWSSLDDEELHLENGPQDMVQLQDLESVYLQDSLLSGPSQDDSLLAFSSPGLSPDGWPSPDEPPITAVGPQPPSPEQQHRLQLPRGLGPEGGAHLQGSLPSVDSISLPEEGDEVFYN